jgi:hypothetical protein
MSRPLKWPHVYHRKNPGGTTTHVVDVGPVELGNRATLHNNVTALFTLFGVKSRAALMALWLEGNEVATTGRKRGGKKKQA